MKKLMTWLALPAMICALFMMAEAEPMNWNENTGIDEVMAYSGFVDWGRLIFPADEGYYSGSTLKDLRLTWYSNIQPAKTVEIVNYFKEMVDVGETVFYDIYTDAEKAADPWKADTGLFFFKGNPGAKFAICNAGGGFAYVGAMHDSFPHALELSKKGYNAFALIYRPGAQTACEDLARRGSGEGHRLHPRACGRAGSRCQRLLPLGRQRGREDGGVAGQLWHGGLWRGGISPPRRSDHAVHGS